MSRPERLVYLNGVFVPEKDAGISIYDSALMFGDTVFEMTRSFNGRQFMLREHLERLYRGVKQLRIPLRESIDEMETLVHKTVEMNMPAFDADDEHRIMINVSRGPLAMYKSVFDGKIEPTVVIADFPLKWTVAGFAKLYDTGVHAVVPNQRAIPSHLLECKIKNRSRLHYLVANLEVSLVDDPAAWALLLDPDGYVAEGTGANFFIVIDSVLCTPEGRNILRGITRDYLLELAEELGIKTCERNIELYDVIHADEAFYTSTAMSVMPCTRINGFKIGTGQPGRITGILLDEWSRRVGVDIIKQTRDYARELDSGPDGTTAYRFGRGNT